MTIFIFHVFQSLWKACPVYKLNLPVWVLVSFVWPSVGTPCRPISETDKTNTVPGLAAKKETEISFFYLFVFIFVLQEKGLYGLTMLVHHTYDIEKENRMKLVSLQ